MTDTTPHFFETYRGTVQPEQCDDLGHMNVQYYYAALWQGALVLHARLGLPQEEIARRGLAFAVARMETDFMRELRAGEAFVLETAVMHLGGKSMIIQHRMRHDADNAPVMQTKVVGVLMDLNTRMAQPIPDDLRARATALLQAAG